MIKHLFDSKIKSFIGGLTSRHAFKPDSRAPGIPYLNICMNDDMSEQATGHNFFKSERFKIIMNGI